MPDTPTLRGSNGPLQREYDALLTDLDGVVYRGNQAVEHAEEALSAAREAGMRIAFVTNNASRTREQVADQLRSLGIAAQASEVATASMAASSVLAARLAAGAPVLVVGGEGLVSALRDAGLRPVHRATDRPAAVVQGWAPQVDWAQLAEGCVAIRAGVPWMATNLDATLPSNRGPLPGNGSLVAALVTATGARPESVGKPEPAMFDAARRLTDSERPLVVGDRLETDIAGGRRSGIPALCVLTGVSTGATLLAAPPDQRPDYIGRDLRALDDTHPAPAFDDLAVTVGTATGTPASDGVALESAGDGAADSLDCLRALCILVWSGRCSIESAQHALDTLDLDPS